MEKDFEIYRDKKERVKSIALKAKKESSDDETSTSESDDKEYAMALRNFKKFFRRNGKFVRHQENKRSHFDKEMRRKERVTGNVLDAVIQIISLVIVQNHLVTKDQNAFIGGSWSDSKNDVEDKTNDETCPMAQSSNEVTFNSSHNSYDASSPDNDSMQIEYDSLCEISLKSLTRIKF
nr:alpha/beta hydrolases superfamily protein [Tanacetum cinerariifolium]